MSFERRRDVRLMDCERRQREAIFGWTGGRMASLYTRAANRKRLSLNSMHLLANEI